jgi:hypothetical protein
VEPEKEPLIGKCCVRRNNGVMLEAFSVRFVPKLYNEGQLSLRDSLETADRRVGGFCEMTVSLRGRESGSGGTSNVGRRYQATAVMTATENTNFCVIVICIVTSCSRFQ